MKNILFVLAASLALSSCAALTRYKCNSEYAAKKGMEDADAGRLSQPSKLDGASCDGDYSSATFSKDYLAGFDQKKNEICQKTQAATYGRSDGQQGLSNKPQLAKLTICQDEHQFKSLQNAYQKEFTQAFCNGERASKLGETHGKALQASVEATAFTDCHNQNALKSAYKKSYAQAMQGVCTVAAAEEAAKNTANARHSAESGFAPFSQCDSSQKEPMKVAYDRVFALTSQALKQADAAKAAADAAQARNAKIAEFESKTATAPFTYNQKQYSAHCSIASDLSFVKVEVENPYPEQVLIQGNWRVQYFNNDFARITDDQSPEAVLLTPNSKKSFQKLTLPKDGRFCRAEFVGAM